MPAADEFTGPVGYSSLWVWLAVVGAILVLLWFLGVWAWSVSGHPKPTPPRDAARARADALAELDRIGHRVRAEDIDERAGWQQMSSVVRGFVSEATGLPTHTMVLADLRALGIPHLAETVAVMYPPEFAPDGDDDQSFPDTLARAKQVVATWS